MENTPSADQPRRTASTGRRHSSAREMLLRMVEAQSAPVSTAALAQSAALHENTVRGHLEQLEADGYLIREREAASGRGRPAWLWRAVDGGTVSPYASLAAVLADTLAHTSADPAADARRAGRTWGEAVAADLEEAQDAASARRTVVAVMRDQGFAPDDTGDAVVLRRCPLIEAASRHPEVVCAVHLGMIDGVLRSTAPDAGASLAADLVPFTGPGECTLHLRATS